MRGTEGPERTSRQHWVDAQICISGTNRRKSSPVRAREVHNSPLLSAGEQIRNKYTLNLCMCISEACVLSVSKESLCLQVSVYGFEKKKLSRAVTRIMLLGAKSKLFIKVSLFSFFFLSKGKFNVTNKILITHLQRRKYKIKTFNF